MGLKFANNAAGTLSAGISASATSFVLQSGEGAEFPTLGAGDYCYVRLGTDASNEVVKVTAISTDTFTCDATAGAWSADDTVILTVTNEALSELALLGAPVVGALTSGTNISWDLLLAQSATLTLAHNATLSNPTNLVAGAYYSILVTQDGTGSRTLAYGTSYDWFGGGTAPTLSTTAGSVDLLTFYCDGTTMHGNSLLDSQ